MENTLPVTNDNGYFEIRLESIGGMGANLCGKMLGELGALYPFPECVKFFQLRLRKAWLAGQSLCAVV